MPRPSLTVRAHAKINLDLRIGGRRADGYHDVRTIFQSLALHDEIELRPVEGRFRLTCTAPDVPADESNLVWRAGARLAAALGRPFDGLAITIRKRVPAKAGLGGGSADAAATLRLLAAYWEVEPDAPVLARVAGELGADVPFFLVGGTALGTGRGDRVHPLDDVPEHHVLLLLPPFGISTAGAYHWLDQRRESCDRDARGELTPVNELGEWSAAGPRAWDRLLPRCSNDLEPAVAARHPEIAAGVDALRAAGAVLARMSGSGSAVAGLFRTQTEAAEAAVSLRPIADRDGWSLLRTRTIGRRAYEEGLRPTRRSACQ